MIVSGVLCKRLCLYAQEIKMKNVVLFQQVCIFHFCYEYIQNMYILYTYVCKTCEVNPKGNPVPVHATLAEIHREIFSCPLLCATCETNSHVDLHNGRLSITILSVHLFPSFPSFSVMLTLTWPDFAPLAWILPSFS